MLAQLLGILKCKKVIFLGLKDYGQEGIRLFCQLLIFYKILRDVLVVGHTESIAVDHKWQIKLYMLNTIDVL